MPSRAPQPVKVLIRKEKRVRGKQRPGNDRGIKVVENKHGIIITDKCGNLDMKRNKFTGKIVLSSYYFSNIY